MIQAKAEPCTECGCKRVDKLIWGRLSPERRAELRKDNRYNRAYSRGLCHRCASAARRRRDAAEPRPAVTSCTGCGGERDRRGARGLCHNCYMKARRDGSLPDHERVTKPAEEVLDEWDQLADSTAPVLTECRRLAPRMGMRPDSLRDALRRAGIRSRYGPGGYNHKGEVAA